MANPIEQAAKAIRGRLAELVGEQQQLQKALRALEGLLGSERGRAAEAPASKTGRGRPARRAAAGARRQSTATRRRGGPSRAEQFVALVSERPGITVAEAADRLGTSRNTLYNLSARLQREGRAAQGRPRLLRGRASPAASGARGPSRFFELALDNKDYVKSSGKCLLSGGFYCDPPGRLCNPRRLRRV